MCELFESVVDYFSAFFYIVGGTVLTCTLLFCGLVGITWLLASCGAVDVACKDHLPAPGYSCNSGAKLIVVDRVAICRCEGGSK